MRRALLACLLLPAPAFAQDTAPPRALTVSGDIAFLSDYRVRGVSRSDGDPSAQASVAIEHDSGLHALAQVTRVAGFGGNRADAEIILAGGIERPLLRGTIDLGARWTLFPGGAAASDFVELTGVVAGTIGPLSLAGGAAYAPAQRALGPDGRGRDALYVSGDADLGIPGRPISIDAHIGHSRGGRGYSANGFALAPGGPYWDWALGVSYVRRRLTLSARYVDTDLGPDRALPAPPLPRPEGGATGVISLRYKF